MLVTREDRLRDFGDRHVDSSVALTAWLQTVQVVHWRNPADVRATYRSADIAVPISGGRKVVVFNIKGNKYRLIAAVDYQSGIVNVLRVMTHAEYSRNKWKDTL